MQNTAYLRYEKAFTWVARAIFLAGLLYLLLVERTPLGFFLFLVFGGIALSAVVIFLSSLGSGFKQHSSLSQIRSTPEDATLGRP